MCRQVSRTLAKNGRTKERFMSKVNMSWTMFDLLSKQIVEHYREEEIGLIVGVARGGLPLATVLSHALDIPMLCLNWQTRDGFAGSREIDFLQKLNQTTCRSKVLFVDDICDSGRTIEEIQSLYPLARFSVLVDKIKMKRLVEYAPNHIEYHKKDEWVVFPWEKA